MLQRQDLVFIYSPVTTYIIIHLKLAAHTIFILF
jgi:hypothetical protein